MGFGRWQNMMPFLGHKLICPRYPSRSALATVQRKCRHAPAIRPLATARWFPATRPGKSPETCPARREKIFCFSSEANQLPLSCRPVPKEGTSAVVTNVGAGCGGRDRAVARLCAWTNGAGRVRRSRVVLTPRRWRQVGDDASHHADEGGKKARSPGRARRKP
jgi:hypothetical protein